MLSAYEQHAKRKLIAIIVSVAVIAGIVVFTDHINARGASTVGTATTATTQTAPAMPAVTTPSTDSGSSSNSSSLKDGTYSASSSYYVPHGNESIAVNLTLQNGTITAVSIQNSENDRDSQLYQEEFASSYKNYVVGKKISGLKLSVIAGASDTTQGFNDALSQIASQAQA